ncbi:BRISC complex subunit FAM175B [Anabrus simplex]|uniref:BRISC complex subunit FAM175B n=1 Tax=Anabrus simplex TaxID=316456 RepID=UPI0034DD6E15
MASHICVTVSGPALSFLIYENVNSFCDQEGFLLGEIISHVTDTISDAQIRGEKTETLISINSLMPLPHSVSFYNGIGKVNPEKLKAFMRDKTKEVVGWYSFRRNSSLVPHLRDRLLHKELSAALPHVSPEHFTMCLLNTAVTNGGSTHIFNHKFMRYRHSKFETLPMQVHNLGEAQPEYKVVPSTACLSESFNNIIASLKATHENTSDVELIRRIQDMLQKHLRKLISDVAASELKAAELEKEVDMLRQQSRPLPNEILLPHLLRDDVSNINKLDLSSSSSQMSDSTPHHTPVKGSSRSLSSSVSSGVDIASTNHIGVGGDVPKTSRGEDARNSPEPFAYVTEMKIQMSQPRGMSPMSSVSTDSSSNNINNNNNNKRATERSRGAIRGVGRGTRAKNQQLQQQMGMQRSGLGRGNNPETFPNLRGQPDSATSPSPSLRSPQVTSSGSKRRGGYAQALKRPGNPVEAGKPTTRAHSSNSSGSQEY